MSTRTKGFFEQDHQAKNAHWHRQHPGRAPLNETSVNVQPLKPAIPATAKAKSKLKAFQFVHSETELQRSENTLESHNETSMMSDEQYLSALETQADSKNVSSAPAQPTCAADSLELDAPSKTPQLLHAHTFPCTPGARLPLQDLIGNVDEQGIQADAKKQSPEEHIGWIPNSSSALLTPNRKRKRARSSSPSCPNTSSQRQEASVFFAANGAEVQKKTPLADPSTDLWQRYAASKEIGEDARMVGIDQHVFQGTPKPVETPINNSGLRRWASTGNDWPGSKNKRPKINTRADIMPWEDGRFTESGNKSKVATMVERLQESLATQKLAAQEEPVARVEGPSSSSPLPQTGGEQSNIIPPASPLQTRRQQALAHKVAEDEKRGVPGLKAAQATPRLRPLGMGPGNDVSQPSRPVEDAPVPAPLHLQNKAPLPAYKRPSMTRTLSSGGRQYPVKSPPKPAAVMEEFDEFGDAFELSAEDIDELVSHAPRSLYDIPQHPNPPSHPLAMNHVGCNGLGAPSVDLTNDENDDEFGGAGLDEISLAQVELEATQSLRMSFQRPDPRKAQSPRKADTTWQKLQQSSVMTGHRTTQRFRVKQVVESEYTNDKCQRRLEKCVVAEDERTSMITTVTLRGSWASTCVSAGDIVHVSQIPNSSCPSQRSDSLGLITVDDAEDSQFIIIHPDHMLSATTIADSFDCVRKAVLQDRIKATGETSKAMVYGSILHEIFQQALSANQWDERFLADLTQTTIRNHVEALWELGMKDFNLATEEITAKMSELAAWADAFVNSQPSKTSVVDDKRAGKLWMSVSKLIAIEEHVWSPRFGLKGNIDATVQTTIVDHPNEPAKRLLAPFEVKTGRTTQSAAHQAQTALYTLLLSDRYDATVKAGILYYLESSNTSRIAPPATEIRQMMQQRNRLAAYIHRAKHPPKHEGQTEPVARHTQEIEESGLPQVLKDPFKCGRCYARQSCFSYHALVESGSADSAGMVDDSKRNHSLAWQEAVGHLALSAKSAKSQNHADILKKWFAKWDRLLTFEEHASSRIRKELWTMSSTEREGIGRCFGNLVIAHDFSSLSSNENKTTTDGVEGSGGKINRFAYAFTRASGEPKVSFTENTQMTVGEPVVVSSEDGRWALANGYVIAASRHDIVVAVDRKLGPARQRLDDFDDGSNQTFRGTMIVNTQEMTEPGESGPAVYRLDKDEFSNGLALVRNGLVTLMSSHPIHTKLRNQVVFNADPTFTRPSQLPPMPLSQLGEMNEDQRAAVSKVLSAQDYALILGMPGTGKTTTIAHIIQALLAEEKTILLTSFTHTAVDNVLLKIRDITPRNSILRLGLPAKINAQVQAFCHLAATPRTSIEEVDDVYMGCKIVATTCMGTNHAIFNRRAFDVCIVDEASQITLPTSLGPLLHARKFVLVGDHYQLPPLVENREALKGGLDVSLFRQLSEEHPEAIAMLRKQYRMCADIMTLSNTLIYDGRLQCGNDAVAARTLRCNGTEALSYFHEPSVSCRALSQCWLARLTAPNAKVIFANTDPIGKPALENLTNGKNITNHIEATLCAQIVLALLVAGVPGREIGVITLYRSQLALLRQLFKAAKVNAEVEIDSADRFQGRDKECVVLSMVRSNDSGIVGDLLKDWRRVNVALTRARSKLVVLGSRQTLRHNELLERLLKLVDEPGWSLDLPSDAVACHNFDFSSQCSSTPRSLDTPRQDKRQSSILHQAEREPSPSKTAAASPSRVLVPSLSAGNRSPAKTGSQKRGTRSSPKVVQGKIQPGGLKSKKIKEAIAIEIFEDLIAE